MCSVALMLLGFHAQADTPGSGHTVDVTTDNWEDDDDSNLSFEFQDMPVATYSGLHLTLSCQLPGAQILYTTNASASAQDTEAWTVYTQPLYLTQDCTVRFFARKAGYNDSDICQFVFVYTEHRALAPTIATNMERTHIIMVSETPNASIHYTVDGSEPNLESALYAEPVEITHNCTYRARAFAEDMFDSEITDFNVDFLTADAPSATFANKAIVLACPDDKATILYSFDSDAAVDNAGAWTTYSTPLSLTSDCIVRFFSRRPGYNDSEIQIFNFVFSAHQVATPIINTDETGSHIVMSCATENSQIRYTNDGSEPTLQSALYSSPIEVTSNVVIRARAFADGLFDSNLAEFSIMHLAVPAPSAKFENKHLILECSDSKADIWYSTVADATVDNVDAWSRYNAPVALTEDCVVLFYGKRTGFNDSDIKSFNFVLSAYRAADPTIERNAEGTHIVMATTTEGAEIHYTVDGSEPTAKSPLYTAPLLIEHNGTYSAIAIADGLFDSKVNRYVVSNMAVPNPMAQFANKKLALLCPDAEAKILYTTDGSAAVEDADAWTEYASPIALTSDCSIRFFARRDNFNDSDIESLTFVYAAYQMQAPTIKRNSQGTHVTMTAPVEGAEIRYTSDGSEPDHASALYTKPILIQNGATYRARVVSDNYFDSEITEYVIGSEKVNPPTAVYTNFALELSTTDEGVSIWYTTDAQLSIENIDDWIVYSAPISLSEDCTVRFFAGDDDANASDIQSFVFQRADYQVAAPTIERNEAGTHVVMETPTQGATIHYTLDGSEPNAESLAYTEPILIVSNATFRARAYAEGLFESIVTDFYVTNFAVPAPTAAFVNKRLVLSCSDDLASIYYTYNDDATTAEMEEWTEYVAPIALTENCSIHFFARRDHFNDSDIETFVFLRANYQTATPVIERSEDGGSIIMTCETEGAIIRYTIDGAEPTTESEEYTEPIFINSNCTFRARAYSDYLFESEVCNYTVSNTTIEPPYPNFKNKKLELSISDAQASILYTLDPAASPENANAWTLYTEPIDLTEDCIVSYFGRRDGFLDSPIITYDFVYADHKVATPVITYDADNGTVTITCESEDVEIRYTTDNSDPTTESELYAGTFDVDPNVVIRARAFSVDLLDSDIAEINISGIFSPIINGSTLRIITEGSTLVIYSDSALRLPVYNLNGALVRAMDIEPGRNVVHDLPHGLYIIGGIKVMR